MKRLTKKELIERLGATEEEAKIVVQYEGLFPELLDEEEGFKINSETLWEKLNKPQGNYRNFKERKIADRFTEDIDYEVKWTKDNKIISTDKNVRGLNVDNIKQMNGAGYKQVMYLTMDCAKNIAMMTNNDIGKLVRKNFIICERLLRKNIDWINVRLPQKESYKQMSEEIDKQFQQLHNGKHPQNFIYSNEANMINKELLGKAAKDINEFFNSENNGLTRNHLTIEMNQAIHDLQIMNMGFIMSGLVYEQRKQFIRKIVDNKYDYLRNKLNEEYKKLNDNI